MFTCRSAATISSPPGASMKSKVVKSWTPQCSHTPPRPRLTCTPQWSMVSAVLARLLRWISGTVFSCSAVWYVACYHCILTSSWLY